MKPGVHNLHLTIKRKSLSGSDGNTEGKEKSRQEMDSASFKPLYPAELEDQHTPRPFSDSSQYLLFFV